MNLYVISTTTGNDNYLFRKAREAAENIGQNESISESPVTVSPSRPSIALARDFPPVTQRQQTLIEVAQRCALRDLTDQWPLLEGEEIEEDFFSYLLEPYNEFRADTAVLMRKTNMAEVAYLFGLVRIDQGNITNLPAPDLQPRPAMPRALLSPKTMEFIKQLLKSAAGSGASAVGNKLGTMLLNLVMKEVFGVDNDTEHLLKEVRKIVQEEIESNEFARIEGTLIGTLDYLSIQYKWLKSKNDLDNIDDRAELLSGLKTFDNKMYADVMGVLKTEKYSRKGIKTFMMAASVHLVLTQEMALVDPKYKNPNDSGYLLTLQNLAANYKSFVRGVYDKAMNDRNKMSIGTEPMMIDPRGAARIPDMYWTDHVTGEKKTGFKKTSNPERSAEDYARASMEEHRTQVLNTVKEDMGNPPDTFLANVEGFLHFKFQA